MVEMTTSAERADLAAPPSFQVARDNSGRIKLLVRLGVLALVLGGWEIVGRQVNPIFLSYPTAIAAAFVQSLLNGELLEAVAVSSAALFAGYALAVVAGIPIGLLMGRYRMVEWALDTYINALYATPMVALIPVVILWFGLGFPAKLVVVFLMSVFPILINTYIGVRDVSRTLIEVGQAFAADERRIFTKIILPSTVPYIMGGLRLAVGRGVVGMVVAEVFTALTGLGAMLIHYANFFKTDLMFVAVITLMAMGIVLTEAVKYLETRLSPWKESERARE